VPFAQVGGHRLNYRFDGPEDAPVLMLSNSLGTSLAMWQPQVAAFAARFRLLRYDTRGHGASDVPPCPYTIDEIGRDALALLDALGLARVHFCGLSMGGSTGQWLAAHAPERIDKLILCNTGAKIGTDELWNGRIDAVTRHGMDAVADGMMARWFTADFRARDPARVALVLEALKATAPAGYAGCCAALRDADLRPLLARIQAPTLVIAGTHDPATPPVLGEELHRSITGAGYVELPTAHLSNLEASDAFNAAVLRFLT
jgi:3-oxoadipate enol-lactonase